MPAYEFGGARLFVEDDLAQETVLCASAAQSNYLGNVLRLDSGASVLLFNGRDGEWRAEIERPSRKSLSLLVRERTRAQTPQPDLHYVFAPLKSGRLDYMVQKAVEMGSGTLVPVLTQHGQMPRFNVDRARANAIEAAEQCGILSVPDILPMRKLDEILGEWPADRTLVFCDERADDASPLDVLEPLASRPLALLIGPEGGFSGPERERLRALDFVVPLSLGPRILRADTAAVAALAVLQAAAGDWRTR